MISPITTRMVPRPIGSSPLLINSKRKQLGRGFVQQRRIASSSSIWISSAASIRDAQPIPVLPHRKPRPSLFALTINKEHDLVAIGEIIDLLEDRI